MDPLTHSTMGALVAMLVAPAARRRAAALAGVVAGILPDADIFIRSADDALLTLEYHRHFTHAVIFQPVVAVLAASLAWLLLRRRVAWRVLLVPALAAGLSHILCDAWTSYGTRLWWPFSPERVAWDMVSIIDPLVTLPLVAALVTALLRPAGRVPAAAMVWLAGYLGFALVQRGRALDAVAAHAGAAGHVAERITAKPSFANLVVWRGIYEANGEYHTLAVRPGLTGTTVLPGESCRVFATDRLLEHLPAGSRLARDLARFDHFSGSWVAEVENHGDGRLVLGDARYAMLPQRIAPLWGVEADAASPERPVRWLTFRRVRSGEGASLWEMVRGSGMRPAPETSAR